MTVTRRDAIVELSPLGAGTGRYRARLARTGDQRYETGIEHRDAAEVFGAESVATLLHCRVQVSHTLGSPAVGRVVAPFRRVDIGGHSYLEAELEITDASTRARIDRKELSEISMGYSCEMVGNRQINIRYDHCALLERHDRARCGEHCRVHFDSFSVPQPRKPQVMSCPCSPNRSDAVARRDAFRASEPYRANMSDSEVDICLERLARIDQQEASATAAQAQLTYRVDGATESRIDSAAAAVSVSRSDVLDHLRRNVPMHRGVVPTVDQIENAAHAVAHQARMRKVYADSFGGGGQ